MNKTRILKVIIWLCGFMLAGMMLIWIGMVLFQHQEGVISLSQSVENHKASWFLFRSCLYGLIYYAFYKIYKVSNQIPKARLMRAVISTTVLILTAEFIIYLN